MLSALVKLQTRSTHLLQDKKERGATAVEYGLMVALIAVAIIVAVTALGGRLSGLFTQVTNGLPGAAG